MHRRLHLLGLIAFVSSCGSLLRAAELQFEHLWPGWREAASFERIGEFFGRKETGLGEKIFRTQPDSRAGYYFLVRLKHAAETNQARFVLNIIRPDSPDAKTFTFPVKVKAGAPLFHLGLTGTDWPGGAKIHPVAWKLELLGEDGRTLLEEKSFLWEKPAK